MTKDVSTNIDWDAVKAEMEDQDWEDNFDGDGQERMVYLGSVFRLYPSGKYYMPWACSNLSPCLTCAGRGHIPHRYKRRVLKKWERARERCWALARKRGMIGNVPQLLTQSAYRHWQRIALRARPSDCQQCGGCGSREAHLDEIYQAALEEEAETHGYFVTGGEGDPTDIFAGESRDAPEDDDQDDE